MVAYVNEMALYGGVLPLHHEIWLCSYCGMNSGCIEYDSLSGTSRRMGGHEHLLNSFVSRHKRTTSADRLGFSRRFRQGRVPAVHLSFDRVKASSLEASD